MWTLPWVLIAFPVSAQECETFRQPGHDAWHGRAEALAAFEDELATILTEAGQAPLGTLVIHRAADDPAGGEPAIEHRMLNVPAGAQADFTAAIERWTAIAALAPEAARPPIAGGGEPADAAADLTIEFGAPRPELRASHTETCEAELDNVAEAGGLFAQVVAGAIQREGKARPAGRVRIDFWALIDWTGRVTSIEFREDQGNWSWLVPYMEALAPALRYRPATLNGAARTVWMPQQFELEF